VPEIIAAADARGPLLPPETIVTLDAIAARARADRPAD
jgi:hypothetical protein